MPGATVIEEPELWGVQNVSPSAVVLRLAMKTRPGEQFATGRALRARLKTAFDDAGIAAPAPTMWVPAYWMLAGGATVRRPPSDGAPS
jgi:small conductance mechanosensitive channel